MKDVVEVGGVEVARVEYLGEPVVTFAMVDNVHQRPDGTAGRTFRENRERFIVGEDFHSVSFDEIRRLTPSLAEGRSGGKPIVLLTRRGYLKLVKPLTDDRAWAVQGEMIDRYFLVEEIANGNVPVVLDAASRKVIGGIVKSVVHSELQALVEHQVAQALSSDPRRAVLNYVSVRQLLDEARALRHGRNSLNRSVGNDLRSRALTASPPVALSRCPHTGVWLFPRDFATAYMRERGLGLVTSHNNRVTGQGSLPLGRA